MRECKVIYSRTLNKSRKGLFVNESSIESETRIKLIPEYEHEKENLDALWKLVIRCDKDSKVLCPIGSYLPATDDGANFVIQDQ